MSSVSASSDFEQKIRPFLQQYCIDCHGEKKQKGDSAVKKEKRSTKEPETFSPAALANETSSEEKQEQLIDKGEEAPVQPLSAVVESTKKLSDICPPGTVLTEKKVSDENQRQCGEKDGEETTAIVRQIFKNLLNIVIK